MKRIDRLFSSPCAPDRPRRGAAAPPWRLWALAAMAVLSSNLAVGSTLLSFDDIASPATITTQFGPRGVLFQGAYLDTDPAAHSGRQVLRTVNPSEEIFNAVPLVMTFTSAQAQVKLFASHPNVALDGTLTAYGANGVVVARDGPKLVAANVFTTPFEVRVATASIMRVELQLGNSAYQAIDDLEFSGQPPGDVPTTPPTLRITAPAPNQTTDATTFRVRGVVRGAGLSPQAQIRVQLKRPPGSSTTSVYSYPISLAGTGNRRTFSQVVSLGLGPQTITVEAENTGGLKGQASVVLDALPASIRTRSSAEEGLGEFVFGSVSSTPECTYAVYGNGAVASVNGQTFVVRGALFTKWLSLKDPGLFPQLGCPKGEERTVVDNGRVQDFSGGRLYATAAGAFLVPTVFASAIDVLGGEEGTGLPIADPTSDSRPVFATWLFQQFRRKGIPLPSTLEIRGDPPRLYVERQAGDGSLFEGILRANNPTISQDFACSGTSGPCSVAAPPDEPLFPDTARFCNNKEFNWKALVSGVLGANPDPPEWVPIHGHYVQTPIWGALFDVHLANGDNPFAHRNSFEPCPTPGLEALVNEKICPSDWDLKIRPLPGFRSMQPEGRNAVQIEFERVDAQAQLVKYGDPTLGDLIFASGRFIVDCGHGPKFKTEIHPPSVYAAVSSVTKNGRPATQADIWVNRFFPGGDGPGDVVEFDITPPPRPTPDATLGVLSPGDQNAAVTVTFKPVFPFGPVRVRVSANRGEPEVNKYGQLMMRGDDTFFGFDGRLFVYWDTPPMPSPTPVPTPTPTPRPRTCGIGQKCCEPSDDGGCALCVPRNAQCQ